ncbi:MAG: RluA family pseudouridine synthase [Clostridia bacterium]|nr:RluA family pseudouridine synthase [Clostridia bacterium]
MMYRVLFENENILAVEKRQGFPCEPAAGDADCLISAVKRELDPAAELCHRLDRNTGGIVLLAKNSGALEAMEQAQKDNLVTKTYEAVVIGNAFARFGNGKKYADLKAYHFKDSKLGMVYIYDAPRKLARQIETKLRPLSYDPETNTSACDVILVTGRTHQIRAHLAHLGFPVAGDGKYGRNADNKKLGYKYQALWAKRIDFDKKLREPLGLPAFIESVPGFEMNTKRQRSP